MTKEYELSWDYSKVKWIPAWDKYSDFGNRLVMRRTYINNKHGLRLYLSEAGALGKIIEYMINNGIQYATYTNWDCVKTFLTNNHLIDFRGVEVFTMDTSGRKYYYTYTSGYAMRDETSRQQPFIQIRLLDGIDDLRIEFSYGNYYEGSSVVLNFDNKGIDENGIYFYDEFEDETELDNLSNQLYTNASATNKYFRFIDQNNFALYLDYAYLKEIATNV